MKLQSGGKFDQGAATAGEMRLSIFRKRPDPKRKPTALRINYSQTHFFIVKEKIHVLWVLKQTT